MLMDLLCTKRQIKTSNMFKYSLSLLECKLRKSILGFLIDTQNCILNELCYFTTKSKQMTQTVVIVLYQARCPAQ